MNARLLPGALTVVALVAASGCDRASMGARGAVIQDSAGVRVLSLAQDVAADSVVALALDSSWRSSAGSEGELVDVQAFSDGRLAVLDRASAAVVVLSPEGEPRGWIGRPGEGPGELSPGGLTQVLVTDSSVVVPDLFQQRTSEFSVSGTLLSVDPFPGGGGYAVDWRWGPAGGITYRVLRSDGDMILHMGSRTLDTLHVFPPDPAPPNRLLPSVPVWAISDRILAVATSDQWAVDVFEMPGHRHVLGIRRGGHPPRFTESDRTSLSAVLGASAARESGGREPTAAEMGALLGRVAFPDFAPVLAGLLLAPNGDLWVRRAMPVAEMGREALRVGSAAGYGGPEWEVFEDSGAQRARVRLPDGFSPRDFLGPFLYGLMPDRLGVPRPARVVTPWS
jgi:hypothetical protein